MTKKEKAAFRKGCIYMERKLRKQKYKAFDEGFDAGGFLFLKNKTEEQWDEWGYLLRRYDYVERHKNK